MLMTLKERHTRIASLTRAKTAILHKSAAIWSDHNKLMELFIPLDLPKTFYAATMARFERDWAELDDTRDLFKALDDAQDTLWARPYTTDYVDAYDKPIIMEGWLPNLKPTSTDEAEALQMLADYRAAEAASEATVTDEGEPF